MQLPKRLYTGLLASGLLALSSTAFAQEYHNSTEQINDNYASGAASVTFGPNANITINGNWYLTASTVTIDPAAQIGGTGTLHIMTPATYGKAASTTTLNAGGVMGSGTGIGCKVSLENGSTITLAGSNDLVMNNTLSFAKTGAHLLLGTRNLVFTAAAAAVPDATPPAAAGFSNQPADATADFRNAYAVTNGAGTLGKQALVASNAFTFPVGFTAATGTASDYTPATVTNTTVTRDLNVRVQNYAASAPTEINATKGVNRTWQIIGSTTGDAVVALTHNANTEGSAFDPSHRAVVTQFGQNNYNAAAAGALMAPATPNYTQSGTFPVATTGDATYFSKTSDSVVGVNQYIAVSPKAFLQGPYNGTTMNTTLRNNNLIPAAQPYNAAPFGYTGAETASSLPTNATDWILVELRDATTPTTVVASRTGLILSDGTVTDVDGVSPLVFRGTTPGNYYVALRHRNHLGIRSAAAQTFTQDAATAYDFTTAQTQAYQNSSITSNAAQASLAGGNAFGMWAGNANGNSDVKYSGPNNDVTPLLSGVLSGNTNQTVSSIYSSSDLDLNGNVKFSGPSNDILTLLTKVLGGNTNLTIRQH